MYEALYGHTSEETAYTVDDYPYGFTLRCKIRYWIETSPTHGDRFCSQTTNPKVPVERWNKPKKSTYNDIAVMTRNTDNGHIKYTILLASYDDQKKVDEFLAIVTEPHRLTDLQQHRLSSIRAMVFARETVPLEYALETDTEEKKAAHRTAAAARKAAYLTKRAELENERQRGARLVALLEGEKAA